MNGAHDNLKKRTQDFALCLLKYCEALPRKRSADVIARQLMRSALSVGANYRAACRAKLRADFIAKLGIVEEEADECIYWCELLVRGKLAATESIQPLIAEANELLSIVIASSKTARRNAK